MKYQVKVRSEYWVDVEADSEELVKESDVIQENWEVLEILTEDKFRIRELEKRIKELERIDIPQGNY